MAEDIPPEYDLLYKVVLIGESGGGKTSILLRYSDNMFYQSFSNTIGVDFKIKTIEVDGKKVKLQIWDTAGQERFKTITSSYYSTAHGVLVVYDISSRESFSKVSNWLKEIDSYGRPDVQKILLGNKCDLIKQRAVTEEEGKEFAQQLNMEFLETSAKDAINIEQAFHSLVKSIMANVKT